jgi:hypothetical protein
MHTNQLQLRYGTEKVWNIREVWNSAGENTEEAWNPGLL